MGKTKQLLTLLALLTVLIIGAGELFAKYYLGLGSPPLTIEHPQIEYLLKPNQNVYRFGNRFVTNNFSMRSDPFPEKRLGAELRIMVFGDSVLNGGNLIDQKHLATNILQDEIRAQTGKTVVTGNISADSWGPGNWLAYATTFGFFDADIIVLVVSSHDYADIPTFAPLSPNSQPTVNPISALSEGIDRYILTHVRRILSGENKEEIVHLDKSTSENVASAMGDLEIFLDLAKRNAHHVMVVQHWDRKEVVSASANSGNHKIGWLARSMGLQPVQLYSYFRQSIDDGENPFYDNIHPSDTGQQLIARALLENLPENITRQNLNSD